MQESRKRPNPVEYGLEWLLFASRWLLAPVYLGLAVAMLLLVYAFLRELIGLAFAAGASDKIDIMLAVLTLIDLSLVANLLMLVIVSGYENFVSKFSIDQDEDRPSWQGKVDFSAIKVKLIASLVAIAGIQLLQVFMEIAKYTDKQIFWMVVIYASFVIAGVLLAAMDRIGASHGESGSGKGD